MIRYLAKTDGDLYVLDESVSQWSIKRYPNGNAIIEDGKSARFGDIHLNLGGSNFGLEANIMREVMARGVKVQDVGSIETEQFCRTFTDDVFLKSDVDTDWPSFVHAREQGIEVANARTDELRRLNERIVSMIKDDPYRLSIPGGNAYAEVNFSNTLSHVFRSDEDFQVYLQDGIEPGTAALWGVTRPDMVFVDDKHSYILELKFGRKREPGSVCKLSAQQMLAGQYVLRNFDVPFTLVAVKIRQDESGKIRLGYEHKILGLGGTSLRTVESHYWDDITERVAEREMACTYS